MENWINLRLSSGLGNSFGLLFGFFENLIKYVKPILMMAIADRDLGTSPTVDPAIDDNAADAAGRIISVAIFKTSVNITAWDAAGATEFDALIDANDMFVLGPVRGQLNEATVNKVPGYGLLDERAKNESYDIVYQHLGSTEAIADFYNKVMYQPGDWSVMFIMENLDGYFFTQKGPIPQRMSIDAKGPVSLEGDEIGGELGYIVNCTFKTKYKARLLTDLPAATFLKD